jgi:hypothetical protein
MLRRRLHRTTSLLGAAAYLLALIASNASHVHTHALGDGPDSCGTASSHHESAHHDHDCHDEGTLAGLCHSPVDVPTSDEENCNICQFLGRPILLVEPFELTEASEPVVPLPALEEPAVRPILLVVTHARAPPYAAQAI